MKFALSKNAALASDKGKVKIFKHHECGQEIVPTTDPDVWYCSRCSKTGYLVKSG